MLASRPRCFPASLNGRPSALLGPLSRRKAEQATGPGRPDPRLDTATVRSGFGFEVHGEVPVRNRDSPPTAAKAAVGPVPLIIAVVVRHYCCCVSEEEVLHVTHRAGLAARSAPDREHRHTDKYILLFVFFTNFILSSVYRGWKIKSLFTLLLYYVTLTPSREKCYSFRYFAVANC